MLRHRSRLQLKPQLNRLPIRLAMMLLCVMVLLMQTLGQFHRSIHWVAQGALVQLSAPSEDGQAKVKAPVARVHVDTDFKGLFKDHQDLPKCQLYDSVGTAEVLNCVVLITQASAQGLLVSSFYNVFVVERLTRYFQARAPPYA
jgi:hypothetical protein